MQTDWLLMSYPVFIRLTKKLRSWRLNSELYVVGCIYVVCHPRPRPLPNYLSCRPPPPPPLRLAYTESASTKIQQLIGESASLS